MATITPPIHIHIPASRTPSLTIWPQIGVYGYGVYVAIKRHLNQKTGECFPSYDTIARKIRIDRGTVIRYVKKLKAFAP